MGTYDGLAMPINGEFYHYPAAGSSENWYVEADGVFNMYITDPGADNCVALTVTDSSTGFSSGYMQGYYVSMTTSSAGTYSSGSAQITGFAVDLTLNATTLACEAQGMYIYVAGSTISTMSSANICGLNVYIDDLGGTPGSKSCLTLHMADNSTTSGQDAFIVCRLEGATGTVNSVLQFAGTATAPAYFIRTNYGAVSGKMVQTITVGGTQDKVLVLNLNGSTYWIPLYAASA